MRSELSGDVHAVHPIDVKNTCVSQVAANGSTKTKYGEMKITKLDAAKSQFAIAIRAQRLLAVFAFLLLGGIPAHGEDRSKREVLELQQQCSLRAEKAFRQTYGEPTSGGSTANFESHYNPRMNKCFMVVRELTTGPVMGTKSWASTVLMDAYGQRTYAQLDILDLPWLRDPVGHRHIGNCILWPPHEGKRTCQSEAEFESFVSGFMESTVTPQDTLENGGQLP
jgi:hypothetical protein